MSRARILFVLFAASALLAACQDTTTKKAPVPAAHPDTTALPAGWARYKLHGVSFAGPPDLLDQGLHGVDSVVGRYLSETIAVEFDYGMYSDDSFDGRFDGHTMKSGSIEDVMIDGRPARLATWDDNQFPPGFPHACAIFVPDVQRTHERVGEMKLFFRAAGRDAEDAKAARWIATSVRFETRPAVPR